MARQPGRLAQYNDDCPRCPNPIMAGASRVVPLRSTWIHVECASGGDDE